MLRKGYPVLAGWLSLLIQRTPFGSLFLVALLSVGVLVSLSGARGTRASWVGSGGLAPIPTASLSGQEEPGLLPPSACGPSLGVPVIPQKPTPPPPGVTGHPTVFKLHATGYSSTIEETDDSPFVTASNQGVRSGIVALSRDLLREFTPGAPFGFGDKILIQGLGLFVVADTMSPHLRSRVDIWFPTRAEAIAWGIRPVALAPA